MAATFRTVKASPGFSPRVNVGHTRESAHANTMYCKQERIKCCRQAAHMHIRSTSALYQNVGSPRVNHDGQAHP
jgi:hypothetical protein